MTKFSSGAFPRDATAALDEREMEHLVRRVRSAVRRSCPPYLTSQAEDIAQEVLLKLVRMLHRDEGNRTFSSMYLLKAAHGTAVDEIRRRARRPEQAGLEDESMNEAHGEPGPEELAFGRTLGREIRRCLEKLIDSRRLAVTLHLLGCALPEIAERLGCSPKTADNRVYRGMKNLRECLEVKGLKP